MADYDGIWPLSVFWPNYYGFRAMAEATLYAVMYGLAGAVAWGLLAGFMVRWLVAALER